jgi:hypothetical protein
MARLCSLARARRQGYLACCQGSLATRCDTTPEQIATEAPAGGRAPEWIANGDYGAMERFAGRRI